MSNLPWSERVNMLSINPDAATRDDVAKLAADLTHAKLQNDAMRRVCEAASRYTDCIAEFCEQGAEACASACEEHYDALEGAVVKWEQSIKTNAPTPPSETEALKLQNEEYRRALTHILQVLGEAACTTNKCEGCQYEMEAASDVARRAVEGKTDFMRDSSSQRKEGE